MRFGLVQSFGTDGNLMANSRDESFVLGVEWGVVWGRLKSAAKFSEIVHLENKERISSMLSAQGRQFEVSPAQGGFISISVDGLD